ncbi:PLD nuclease N-terminal domain-containing protein [Pseudarthrobacter sp. J75]|uniref:PLD nuclease N-terminal domain-containing protein n=1 Tax=unclassified Pseudarthrobacter TaxID=2647000 RepID=UPI002E81E9A7|nr:MULTISPECIES: PLD nuclease N-terminal domain-containing protein [unclassified Pseudarthrobacter]MEE2522190.1 PLD nuclease N-terminal domain-containing protein [Pseudarthrobacter sp. J47]MEE2528164.1 PLD nuclease N-terminal domain-containing protein [Pseudarthrobacter sp. J75]MEE2567867.1 PLD nuclease N-terminal domain-containing protein [Pseudarthrobacter sp. J64]
MLFRVVLAIAVLAIFVYGLVDVIRTDRSQTRGISKPAWIVVMIVLPVLGAILWLLLGRPAAEKTAPRNYSHPSAPDDDPEFLRNLEMKRRNQAEAERLRKLKDELDAKERGFKGDSAPGDTDAGS